MVYESRVVRITIKVMANPYLNPVYEYAIANMIGAYIPYDFDPITYLATLTIVATIITASSNSNTCCGTPVVIIH